MRVFITGGCGFLGTSFIRFLIREGGHTVRVLDDLSVGERKDLARTGDFIEVSRRNIAPMTDSPDTVELVVGDILDERLALAATEGAEAIIHLAANAGVAPSVEDPRKDCLSNVVGL